MWAFQTGTSFARQTKKKAVKMFFIPLAVPPMECVDIDGVTPDLLIIPATTDLSSADLELMSNEKRHPMLFKSKNKIHNIVFHRHY